MALNITIDGTLTLDQTSGVQAPTDGDDASITYGGNVADPLGGTLDTAFLTYLNGLGLNDAQKEFAALVDGASSGIGFVTCDNTANEEVSDLFLSDADGHALNGDLIGDLETLANEALFLWSDPTNSDFVLVTTSGASLAAGRVVGVIYLDESDDFLSGQVQMVTFEAIQHPVTTNPDDALDLTDVLQVSATGSLSFKFDELESGNFLWVAIGSGSAGLLVTGQDLNVNDQPGNKLGNLVNGGADPCDTVNTSQGGINATIGVNSQHFVGGPKVNGQLTNGPVAVFTLVTNFVPLDGQLQATGIDVEDIDYDNYINTSGASIFISQVTGGSDTSFKISLFEAGNGGADADPEDLNPEEGYADNGASDSYIGNQGDDAHLKDDTEVDVASVTIGAFTWLYTEAGIAAGIEKGGITVKIDGHIISVSGPLDAGDVVAFTAIDSAGSEVDGTFNRFTVQGLAGTGAFDIGQIDIDQGITQSEGLGADLLIDDDGPAIGNIPNSTVQFVNGATAGPVALSDLEGTDGEASLKITDFTASFSILGNTIEGEINAAGTEVKYFDADGVHWYTLSLTQNGDGADFYNFTVVNAPEAPPLEFDFTGLPSGQNLFGMVADAGKPDGAGIVFFANGAVVDPTSHQMTNASTTINTSKGGGPTTIGVSNQMIDPGEGVFFTFVNDPTNAYLANFKPGGLDQNEADDADNMTYNEHPVVGVDALKEVGGAFFRVSQTQGNDAAGASITAYNITDNSKMGFNLLSAPKTQVNVTNVRVYDGSNPADPLDPLTLLESLGDTDNDGISITIVGGVATITGLEAGYVVEWETATPSDQALIGGTAGKFDIGGFGLSEAQETPDHSLTFEVTITDGDGDTAVDDFIVNVDAIQL